MFLLCFKAYVSHGVRTRCLPDKIPLFGERHPAKAATHL